MTQTQEQTTASTTVELVSQNSQAEVSPNTWDQYCAINDWSDACRVYDV